MCFAFVKFRLKKFCWLTICCCCCCCCCCCFPSCVVPDSEKLGVVLSARVHPGETNASWMMKGMMDFLTSSHHVAEVRNDNVTAPSHVTLILIQQVTFVFNALHSFPPTWSPLLPPLPQEQIVWQRRRSDGQERVHIFINMRGMSASPSPLN